MLRLRRRALRGCGELVTGVISQSDIQNRLKHSSTIDDAAIAIADRVSPSGEGGGITYLWATCGLLLLYEKLSGGSQENGSTHLEFFVRLFPTRLWHEAGDTRSNETMHFLSILFLYNDIIRSTSLRTPTLSTFFLARITADSPISLKEDSQTDDKSRFEYPGLIARMSSGDITITDADIAGWGGRLDWFPSFALLPLQVIEPRERLPTSDPAFVNNSNYHRLDSFTRPWDWSETIIVSELYRVAATIYRKQCTLQRRIHGPNDRTLLTDGADTRMGNLPSWAVELIQLLPSTSILMNALLWPVSIIGKELTLQNERSYIAHQLQSLEKQFKLKTFSAIRDYLMQVCTMWDQGLLVEERQNVFFG